MIYFPEKELLATPTEVGLSYQELFFSTPSGRKLHGWFLPNPQAKATLLFFHGNAGNISHRLEKLRLLHEASLTTFIIDYSGYGLSEGRPSEKNLYEDGLAAYAQAVEGLKIDPSRLILYGESLGSGVAIELALQKETAGIILEGAFASLKNIAKRHMPYLAALAGNAFDNLWKIAGVTAPILFIHSKNDEICPFEEATALFEKTTAPKSHCWLERGGHNDAFFVEQKNYKQGIQDFLRANIK